MNLNDLWSGLTGKGGPFGKILKALEGLEKDHDQIKSELGQIEIGATQWQQGVSTQLMAIQAQLDRIEEALSGDQAATLIVTVGEPFEQE